MIACRICGNRTGNARFAAREMMFGLRDEFDYVECAACGCLQIAAIPERVERYYPKEYYSYNAAIAPPQSRIRGFLRRRRLENILGRPNPIGELYEIKAGQPTYYSWLRRARCRPEYSIADVGCGNGSLLVELSNEGFDRLTGIEPYLERDVRYGASVAISRALPAGEPREPIDLIMLHHSFEHMPDPLAQLRRLHVLLKPDRYVLVRTPVKAYAWEQYRADWVQLDAPRHFHIHTEQSMRLLAGKAGFTVDSVEYDSHAMQFWGSEQYRRDIPLRDAASYLVDPAAAPFTREQIAGFASESIRLNREGRGDQACFYLHKP